jgi:hypothetical protein
VIISSCFDRTWKNWQRDEQYVAEVTAKQEPIVLLHTSDISGPSLPASSVPPSAGDAMKDE